MVAVEIVMVVAVVAMVIVASAKEVAAAVVAARDDMQNTVELALVNKGGSAEATAMCGIAVPCGAVRYGAVRCGAVRCGAVRCGAVRNVDETWLQSRQNHTFLRVAMQVITAINASAS